MTLNKKQKESLLVVGIIGAIGAIFLLSNRESTQTPFSIGGTGGIPYGVPTYDPMTSLGDSGGTQGEDSLLKTIIEPVVKAATQPLQIPYSPYGAVTSVYTGNGGGVIGYTVQKSAPALPTQPTYFVPSGGQGTMAGIPQGYTPPETSISNTITQAVQTVTNALVAAGKSAPAPPGMPQPGSNR
jgi:hypothetical protein